MTQERIRLLLVEDDPNLGTILQEYLEVKGYATALCTDGEQGFVEYAKGGYDACILDVMMPVKDGFTLAKEIRKLDQHIPIIFLTAKSMKEDTIEGFRLGGDDYITKPFSMEELLVRLQAIFRRINQGAGGGSSRRTYQLGRYFFDPHQQSLTEGEEVKKLTSKENELLKLLSQNLNNTLDRSFALKAIWNDDSYFNSRSMDVYIAKLRKHLKDEPKVEIVNVHGKGFKLLVK